MRRQRPSRDTTMTPRIFFIKTQRQVITTQMKALQA